MRRVGRCHDARVASQESGSPVFTPLGAAPRAPRKPPLLPRSLLSFLPRPELAAGSATQQCSHDLQWQEMEGDDSKAGLWQPTMTGFQLIDTGSGAILESHTADPLYDVNHIQVREAVGGRARPCVLLGARGASGASARGRLPGAERGACAICRPSHVNVDDLDYILADDERPSRDPLGGSSPRPPPRRRAAAAIVVVVRSCRAATTRSSTGGSRTTSASTHARPASACGSSAARTAR